MTVETVTGYNPDPDRSGDEDADLYYDGSFGHRELVKIDTNYKPTRPGEHPVCLTRTDAIRRAAALLEAVEDTFNIYRCGTLHPRSAAALLQQLEEVDSALFELRQGTLGDLVDPYGPDAAFPTNDTTPTTARPRGAERVATSATPTFCETLVRHNPQNASLVELADKTGRHGKKLKPGTIPPRAHTGWRTVGIPASLVEALKEQHQEQGRERDQAETSGMTTAGCVSLARVSACSGFGRRVRLR